MSASRRSRASRSGASSSSAARWTSSSRACVHAAWRWTQAAMPPRAATIPASPSTSGANWATSHATTGAPVQHGSRVVERGRELLVGVADDRRQHGVGDRLAHRGRGDLAQRVPRVQLGQLLLERGPFRVDVAQRLLGVVARVGDHLLLGDDLPFDRVPAAVDDILVLVLGQPQVAEDVLDQARPEVALGVVPGVELDLDDPLVPGDVLLHLPESRASVASSATRPRRRRMKNVLPLPQSPNNPTDSGGSTVRAASSAANASTSGSIGSRRERSSAARVSSALYVVSSRRTSGWK